MKQALADGMEYIKEQTLGSNFDCQQTLWLEQQMVDPVSPIYRFKRELINTVLGNLKDAEWGSCLAATLLSAPFTRHPQRLRGTCFEDPPELADNDRAPPWRGQLRQDASADDLGFHHRQIPYRA